MNQELYAKINKARNWYITNFHFTTSKEFYLEVAEKKITSVFSYVHILRHERKSKVLSMIQKKKRKENRGKKKEKKRKQRNKRKEKKENRGKKEKERNLYMFHVHLDKRLTYSTV